MCRLIFSHSREEKAHLAAVDIKRALGVMPRALQVLGPAQAPVYKIRNKYRYSIIMKCPDAGLLKKGVILAVKSFEEARHSNVIMKVDRDPYFFM
jgi:primosomal protein N' (replication factor Y)